MFAESIQASWSVHPTSGRVCRKGASQQQGSESGGEEPLRQRRLLVETFRKLPQHVAEAFASCASSTTGWIQPWSGRLGICLDVVNRWAFHQVASALSWSRSVVEVQRSSAATGSRP